MKVVDEALGEEITVQGEHLKGKKKIQGNGQYVGDCFYKEHD